jgi:hypothetical protein
MEEITPCEDCGKPETENPGGLQMWANEVESVEVCDDCYAKREDAEYE